MDRRLKIASWVLVGLLLLPLLQQASGLLKERKLRGSFKIADVPELNVADWFSGEYQSALEPAMNDRVGFHNFFIRVNNQLAFSLFRKALANGVTVGKQNYLYEYNYIKAWRGLDYQGDSVLKSNAENLKRFQDYCESKGKIFLVNFAVGKGSFYPEFFPKRHQQEPGKRNLDSYKHLFDSLGVKYIDFNSWFVEQKESSEYCLYPRTGVHWSYYGMVQVIDSLVNYLETKSGEDLVDFNWGSVIESRKYRSSDKDIEQGMNILFRINYDKLAYPKIGYVDQDKTKLKGVVIADSFYWGLHNMGFSNRIFDHGEYWYYNKRIIANHLEGMVEMDTINRLERLEEVDVVMLMATEATLPKFPFGVENMLDR